MNELGLFIKETPDINVVFINSSLTAIQVKKLEKRWNDICMSRDDRVRQYNLKSAQKEFELSPTESDTSTALSEIGDMEGEDFGIPFRRIRIIDRFGMILQIFASRAHSSMA